MEVSFEELSSGEKVLFGLILCIYNSMTDGRFPSVVLLDEIDASLHPNMIINMLGVLSETLVKKHDLKVILATHSPSTVALADPKWIYVIDKDTPNLISKKSKQEIINSLSQGFVTLDQGLMFADQIARKALNIFSEGRNIDYLKKAIELFAPDLRQRIGFIEELKDITGKDQLRSLYTLLRRLPHRNKVLFVYDCDVKTGDKDENNCYVYVFKTNTDVSVRI